MRRRRRIYVQLAITMVCAVVLAFGSCFAAIVESAQNRQLSTFFEWVFVLAVLAFAGSGIALIVKAIVDAVKSPRPK
jgi:hypothetical protein